MPKNKAQFSVTVEFGSDEKVRRASKTTYEFPTELELNVFQFGLSEMSGWSNYRIASQVRHGKKY